MQIKTVTAYREYALLEFEEEIKIELPESSTSSQDPANPSGLERIVELIIPEIPGGADAERLSVMAMEEDQDDLTILDCQLESRVVTTKSFYESGPEAVKVKFEEFRSAILEVMKLEQRLKSMKEDDEIWAELMKNSASPKVLAAEFSKSRHGDSVKNLCNVLAFCEKMRSELNLSMINLNLELKQARERACAAQQNLRSLTGEIGTLPYTSAETAQDIIEIEKWFKNCQEKQVQDIKINYLSSYPSGKIVKLKIEYLVSSCHWRSEYNLKFSGTRLENCDIEFSAAISQRTGIDWKDIPIYLSYGDPTADQEPKPLKKYYVDLKQDGGGLQTDHLRLQPRLLKGGPTAFRSLRAVDYFGNPEGCEEVQSRMPFGNLKIRLPSKSQILSNHDEQKIRISTFKLSAQLFHHITPESEKKVYRALLLKNTSEWIIENGQQFNVHIQGNLIGATRLPKPVGKNCDFVIYAGEDDLVEVVEITDKDFKSKSGFFISGLTQKSTNTTQLQFKNLHKPIESIGIEEDTGVEAPASAGDRSLIDETSINLIVSHKLPESKNQLVDVAHEISSKGGAENVAAENDIIAVAKSLTNVLNTRTGSYVQKKILKSEEIWQSNFTYTITYPQNEKIKTWTVKV